MAQALLDSQAIASTCAACPYFQSHGDGTNKGWCKLFNHFARETHQQTQDCINTIRNEQATITEVAELEPAVGYEFVVTNGFEFYQKQCDVMCWIGKKDKYRTIAYPHLKDAVQGALRRLKKEKVKGAEELLQILVDAKKAEVQAELNQHIEEQAALLAPDFTDIKIKVAIAKTKIDSIPDIFGALYRVWDGMQLLGTFYENLDGKWIAQPCNRDDFRFCLNTSEQAHLTVVASYLQA